MDNLQYSHYFSIIKRKGEVWKISLRNFRLICVKVDFFYNLIPFQDSTKYDKVFKFNIQYNFIFCERLQKSCYFFRREKIGCKSSRERIFNFYLFVDFFSLHVWRRCLSFYFLFNHNSIMYSQWKFQSEVRNYIVL